MLDRIRIVLVRPQRSGNVGSAARVMMNMGLRDLVLVAPECDISDEQAQGYAMRAKSRLSAARIVPDVPAALAGCVKSFATSGKGGFYRKQAGLTVRDAAGLAIELTGGGVVAIAFGPEDRGLVLEELLLFDRVVEIPSNPDYPALNLAAAVAVVCYELRQAQLAGAAARADLGQRELADEARKNAMFQHLFDALDRIGYFYHQQRKEHLELGLRHLLGRVELGVNEVDILIGIAKQMHYYADVCGPPPQGSLRHADRWGAAQEPSE